MRISDWSSDVCSSDLRLRDETGIPIVYVSHSVAEVARLATSLIVLSNGRVAAAGRTAEVMAQLKLSPRADQIGRASCRERVCQYVTISVVAVYLTQTKTKYRHKSTTETINPR